MEQEYNIRNVAAMVGLSTYTLRYYEKIGLIKPVRRNASGYRIYNEADLSWIQFINRLRDTGMPIREMVRYAILRNEGSSTYNERRLLLEKHRDGIVRKIEALTENLMLIERKIDFYRNKKEHTG